MNAMLKAVEQCSMFVALNETGKTANENIQIFGQRHRCDGDKCIFFYCCDSVIVEIHIESVHSVQKL